MIRTLVAGDEALLDAFLSRHADSSMFLRANAHGLGLEDRGDPFQGVYVAAFAPDTGAVTGAAAHYRNGVLVLQAPDLADAEALARRAADASGREVKGLAGPWGQIAAARTALGLDGCRADVASREILFALDLCDLRVPSAVADGGLAVRLPDGAAELDQMCAWRVAYAIEALGRQPGPELEADARADVLRALSRGELYILVGREGAPLATTTLNANLPDIVQIGGVYTPQALRGRGYAQAVVARQLLDVQRRGVRRAVLFTDRGNAAARRAYEALGFCEIGEYGLILLAR